MAFRGNRGGGNFRNSGGKGYYNSRGRGNWSGPKGEPHAHMSHFQSPQSFNSLPPPQHRADGVPSGPPRPSSEEIVTRHMHDRALYLFAFLLGQTVEVTTQAGDVFEGLLHGCSTDADLGVVLKLARPIHPEVGEDTPRVLVFLPKDIISISAINLDLTMPAPVKGLRGQGFNTDTGISGHSGEIKERELERWVPDQKSNLPFMTLEDTPNQFMDEKGKWDQFAANETLFNVTSNYDELIYTTAIDRTVPNFKENEKVAARLANEILNKSTNNPHVAEERGQEVASELDEETKYSAVVRPNKSTSLAARAKPADANPPSKALGSSDAPPKPTAAKAVTGTRISQKKADAILQLFTSTSKTLSIATQRKLYGEPRPSKPIEEELMGTFRQFVSTEKERLQQTKQTLLKKDKDGKVAELVKFSKTFKLNTPVPEDIKALISKGTDQPKQPSDSEGLSTIHEKPELEPAAQRPKPAAKLNVNASEFKPNPAAKPFTPANEPKKETNAFFTSGKPTLAASSGIKGVLKGKEFCDPSTVAPTWPTEGKPYAQQFVVTPIEIPFPGGPPPAGHAFGHGNFFSAYRYSGQMAYPPMPPMNLPQQLPFMGMPSAHPPPYLAYPNPNPGNHPSPNGQLYYKHPASEGVPQASYPGSPGRPPMYAPPISHSPMMMPPISANPVLVTPRPILGDAAFQHLRPMPPPAHPSGPPPSHPMSTQSPQILGPAFHPPPPQHGSPQHHPPMYPHYPLPQHYPVQPPYPRTSKPKGRSNHDKHAHN
ncbi:poly(A)-binding protein binding protein [Massospora cicadina]|nr:poly(A)-binding protein binding protein [Massospora cicadina]